VRLLIRGRDEASPGLLDRPFQLLHEGSIDEVCRVGAGGFAAETFQQAAHAFEVHGDRSGQVPIAVDAIDFPENHRIVEPYVLDENLERAVFVAANLLQLS
jgi:hypothetical protein